MEHIPRSGAGHGDQEHRNTTQHEHADTGESLPEDRMAFLVEALQHSTREAILGALAEGRPLTHAEARLLISTIPAGDDARDIDIRKRFMISGSGDPAEVRASLQPAYRGEHSRETVTTADWLGTHLIHAQHPQLASCPLPLMTDAVVRFPDSPAERDGIWKIIAYTTQNELTEAEHETLHEQLSAHVSEHDEPFRAFLRLPGVNAQDSALVAKFQAAYLTTVDDPDDLHDPALPVSIDAVDLGGRIHVFDVAGLTGGQA